MNKLVDLVNNFQELDVSGKKPEPGEPDAVLALRVLAGEATPRDLEFLVAEMRVADSLDLTSLPHQKLALMAFILVKSRAAEARASSLDLQRVFKHVDRFTRIPSAETMLNVDFLVTRSTSESRGPHARKSWRIWRVAYAAEVKKNVAFEDVVISKYVCAETGGRWSIFEKFDKLVQAYKEPGSAEFSIDDYSEEKCYADIQSARLRSLIKRVYNLEFVSEFTAFISDVRIKHVAPFLRIGMPSDAPESVPDMDMGRNDW